MNLRVVKLGGSLFTLPDLRRRVQAWLTRQSPQPTVLIAGGGMFTDAVRQFDALHQLPSPASHRLALSSMQLASHALALLLPAFDYVSEAKGLSSQLASLSQSESLVPYVGVWNVTDYWLNKIEPTLLESSRDWSLTSDSIAAMLAQHWQAQSLVLLKSCELPGETIDQWSQSGGVDPQFAAAAAGVNVSWVNLRAEV